MKLDYPFLEDDEEIFRYSWGCLYKLCKKDCNKILKILECYAEIREVEWEDSDLIVKLSKCEKYGYIKNLRRLLINTNSTATEKCVYLYLASLRNIMDYHTYGYETLNINTTSVDASDVERNRLLTLKNENVYFKY